MNIEKFINEGLNLDVIDECFGGNKEIYFRFLGRFFDDKDYIMFNDLMSQERYNEAFNCAHAIKGVAGNLGMTKIYEYLFLMVEKIRNSNYDEIDIVYDRFKQECDRLYNILCEEKLSNEILSLKAVN